jgi:hypothetical protein
MCGGPLINAVENPCRLSLKNIIKPTTDNVDISTVLLNDFWEALLQGFPIDDVPASKTISCGWVPGTQDVCKTERYPASKNQEKLLKYQDVLSFVQGTEDENSIARNKEDLVVYITKTVINKLILKALVIRIPFPVKYLAEEAKYINDCFVPG